MNPNGLDSLLREVVQAGAHQPSSPECLDTRTILRLVDRPNHVGPDQRRHLVTCSHCQWVAALVRREREVIEASWPQEGDAADVVELGAGAVPSEAGTPPRTIRLSWWLGRWPAAAGIAAVVVIAVGLGWWLTAERAALGPITGRFQPASVTRGGEQSSREYVVQVELKTPAHLTWLYLDWTHKLQLPAKAPRWTAEASAGPHSFKVRLAPDEPPGPQWIAAVASIEPFDLLALRDELQRVVDALPKNALFDGVIARLERALSEHRALGFRGHGFVVPARAEP